MNYRFTWRLNHRFNIFGRVVRQRPVLYDWWGVLIGGPMFIWTSGWSLEYVYRITRTLNGYDRRDIRVFCDSRGVSIGGTELNCNYGE